MATSIPALFLLVPTSASQNAAISYVRPPMCSFEDIGARIDWATAPWLKISVVVVVVLRCMSGATTAGFMCWHMARRGNAPISPSTAASVRIRFAREIRDRLPVPPLH